MEKKRKNQSTGDGGFWKTRKFIAPQQRLRYENERKAQSRLKFAKESARAAAAIVEQQQREEEHRPKPIWGKELIEESDEKEKEEKHKKKKKSKQTVDHHNEASDNDGSSDDDDDDDDDDSSHSPSSSYDSSSSSSGDKNPRKRQGREPKPVMGVGATEERDGDGADDGQPRHRYSKAEAIAAKRLKKQQKMEQLRQTWAEERAEAKARRTVMKKNLMRRTKRGQPIMRYRIEAILDKLQ